MNDDGKKQRLREALYVAILICAVVFFNLLIMLILGGCTSARADASGLVIEHQRQIDRLEGTIGRYDAAVAGAVAELDAIAERSAGMAGDIDEIIRLFDEYKSRVDRLLHELDALRNEVKGADEDNNNTRRDNLD